MKGIPYASAVGSLMYAQTCTRPDIAYAVGLLGRYQRHGACLQSNEVSSGDQRLNDHITAILEIVGYSDSDYAGCPDTRKSTSGYVFLLAGGAISWKSEKGSQLLPLHTLSILLATRPHARLFG